MSNETEKLFCVLSLKRNRLLYARTAKGKQSLDANQS